MPAILLELEKREIISPEQKAEFENQIAANPKFESPELEMMTNEMLVQSFFDTNFPGAQLSGQDIGQELNSLVDHIRRLTKRLYDNSRVKLTLVSHSGVIEHLMKLVYLQVHPKERGVSVHKIGGLLKYLEGPRFTITSDSRGEQQVKFDFKDLHFRLN